MPNEETPTSPPQLDADLDSVATEFWIFSDERDRTTGMIALHSSPVEGAVVRMSVSAQGNMIDFDFSEVGVEDLINTLQEYRMAAIK